MRVHDIAAALLVAVAFGCGTSDDAESQPADAPAEMTAAPSPDMDAPLAGEGEALFASKGCQACHTLTDQRLIGPGLQGITERRDIEWFVAMTMNPDSMLANDAAAQALLAEYGSRMTSMGVSDSEARAIYEFLGQH
jgi:mono/diheme cytochrome c family protein